MKSLKWILLGVYLILSGLAALGVGIPFMEVVIGVCGLVAGVLFVANR